MGLYNANNKLSKEKVCALSKKDEFDGSKILSQVITDWYIGNKTIYCLNNNSKKYRLVQATDKSENGIIKLLGEHPEGIFLRFFYPYGGGHCILITKYENNEFYVVDTGKSTYPYVATLSDSYSGQFLKNGLKERIDFVAYLVEENTEPKMTQYYFEHGKEENDNTTSYVGPVGQEEKDNTTSYVGPVSKPGSTSFSSKWSFFSIWNYLTDEWALFNKNK